MDLCRIEDLTAGKVRQVIVDGERLAIQSNGEVVGGVVTASDLDRLKAMDEHAVDAARAKRRGQNWEPWEDALMLDEEWEDEALAIRTERTLKSVRERRRWMRRLAAVADGEREVTG
jgi:hypothetical protein